MPITTILSPHPDDAVLSLWTTLEGSGEVRVMNLFAGLPIHQTGLGWWDRVTAANDPVERARERLDEDRRALALAGRTAVSLDFLDAQYRNGQDPFRDLLDRVAEALPEDSTLLVPAALDDHDDHLQARAVGLKLRDRGHRVELYADVPHATDFGWPSSVTGAPEDPYLDPAARWERCMEGIGLSLSELDADVHRLSPAESQRKLEAVHCYASQVPALERGYSILSRPDVLLYEVRWELPASG